MRYNAGMSDEHNQTCRKPAWWQRAIGAAGVVFIVGTYIGSFVYGDGFFFLMMFPISIFGAIASLVALVRYDRSQ